MTDHPLNSLGLPKAPAETRVVVAMSGGVDSSVVAALLAQQGYEVIGVTLQLYDHGAAVERKGSCCAGRDIHDARAVAERLGIPHYVLDYESRFKAKVIDSFADSYLRGETPIPCVSCNQHIKFADLFETARDLNADVLATGHYVSSRSVDGKQALFRARDADRDQSYFLFATTDAQLELLRFPLGDMTKPEVREHARAFGLAIAEKQDSQDICFVPTGRYADLIERLRPGAATAGDIVHLDGRVLGRHAGILHYTIGQRRGLGLSTATGPSAEPLFVVQLDAAQARVVVGPREALATRAVRLRDINWIGPDSFAALADAETEIAVRLRSTRAPVPATLGVVDGQPIVTLLAHEDGVSPGQACVFYASTAGDARVWGGGTIMSTVAAVTAPSSASAPSRLETADGAGRLAAG
ncbi:tRNA 2-thiouridine(34) synthase MnmA [Lichenihabitans psoromatis]|uniref:tRNA 2-thiouridine(34) synthase MnmA n=1 Tax=Lichenihabitans psoromatis TaxID=2528642 RepID=UPI00103843AE|nr:tRNA 2-thiouridine(34) synthase MnmA [Lichenihabitans psoromatis]